MPRRAQADSSQPSDFSVYRFVEHLPPELIRNRPLKVLETLKEQMENVILRHGLSGVVLFGYTRSSEVAANLARYRSLAETGAEVTIFGEQDSEWQAQERLAFVHLPPESPVAKEWFFAVDSPKFYGALVARKSAPEVRSSGEVLFASTFGFAEGLVSSIHRYLAASCGLPFREYGPRQHDATALLVEEFLQRIEEASQRMSQLSRQLEQEARTDPMTGLSNRRYWTEWLTREFERARRYGHPVSCSLVDLDHFKKVNDAYGHDVGDAVLIELTRLMRRNVRPSDHLCRYGGEEFTILLPHTDLEGAIEQAERLRRSLAAAHVDSHQQTIQVTASIGVASFPGPGIFTADDLVRAADQTMYVAKRSGRNAVAAAGQPATPKRPGPGTRAP